jgi:tetratricopeptide (TPR) repeat protein
MTRNDHSGNSQLSAPSGEPPEDLVVSDATDLLPPPPRPLPAPTRSLASSWRLSVPLVPSPTIPGYEILRELGRGGMGVVYEARQLSLNRPVALKMILAGAHAGLEELLRFRTEAAAAARLQHANIVQIHEVGEHNGQPYLTLEHVPGGSLADKLGGTPLPPRDAARFVDTLARAVHYAHSRGIVHRDLKPANILLAADGSPKITDFGLSTHVGSASAAGTLQAHTQTGAILGTPSYMAPEQATGRGGDIGPTTDVYALGAILYELLTGRPPFRAATPLETLQQVLEEDPVPPSRLQRSAAGDTETICLKCLRKEPGKRYASAADLADDLKRSLNGESIRARRTSRVERLGRWCRRNPRVAVLVGLLALVLAGGLTGVAVQWQRAERQREETDKNYRLARRVVNDYFAVLGTDPLMDHPGARDLRKDLLETALVHFRDLRTQRDDLDLQMNLARGWYCLGRLRAYHGPEGTAREAFEQAIAVQEELVRDHPERADLWRDLARSYDGRARVEVAQRRYVPAAEFHNKALAIRERLEREHPNDPEHRYDLAASWTGIAYLRRNTGQDESGLALLTRAHEVLEDLIHEHPENFTYLAGLSATLNDLGLVWYGRGDFRKAQRVFEAAIEYLTPVFEQSPHATRYRHLISIHYFNIGRYAYLPLDEPIKAADAARKARRLNPEDGHNLWRAARVLAVASEKLARSDDPSAVELGRRCAGEALDTLADAKIFSHDVVPLLQHPDLKSLANRPEFEKLIGQEKSVAVKK